jgi:hypothetical protein
MAQVSFDQCPWLVDVLSADHSYPGISLIINTVTPNFAHFSALCQIFIIYLVKYEFTQTGMSQKKII